MQQRIEGPVAQRILVVEDEHTILELVSEVLAEEGYEVTRAANGADALRAIDLAEPFDLIVLDMWMPIVNGWQFAARLSERGLRLPILVMTAAREARDRAAEIGAVGYIGKPFDVDQFVHAVKRAITPRDTSGPALRSAILLMAGRAALHEVAQFIDAAGTGFTVVGAAAASAAGSR